MKLKKVIDRKVSGNSTYGIPYIVTLTLECGHKILRGEGCGGFEAYCRAKDQQRAKCPYCAKDNGE